MCQETIYEKAILHKRIKSASLHYTKALEPRKALYHSKYENWDAKCP